MSKPLSRKQVGRTLDLIVDHSLRAWKSSDEVRMILDTDAAQRQQVADLTAQLAGAVQKYQDVCSLFEEAT